MLWSPSVRGIKILDHGFSELPELNICQALVVLEISVYCFLHPSFCRQACRDSWLISDALQQRLRADMSLNETLRSALRCSNRARLTVSMDEYCRMSGLTAEATRYLIKNAAKFW